ncbi:hypothetical protein [Streptomyces griseofuscus]|uniref:hypothetical protein n=1 Tax=Streptomyces griseofuscus TaxID=146922 RepID=UPI00369071BA
MLLVLGPGLLDLVFGSDGALLAAVAQVRVGVAWGAPPGGLDGLPPFVGEPGAAAGAHRAAGLALGLVLRGDAAQLLLVLPLTGGVLGLPAGVVGFAARVAPRSVWFCGRPKRRNTAPAGPCSWSCFMPVTTMGSVPSYMWKPPSYAVPFQCRSVSSANCVMTVLGLRGPIRLKTSSSGGCGWSPWRHRTSVIDATNTEPRVRADLVSALASGIGMINAHRLLAL